MPSARLRANFYAFLEDATGEQENPSPFALARSRIDSFFATLLPSRPALQFALTIALLIVGVMAGARLIPSPEPTVITQTDPATQRELADLRARVESMDELVTTRLLTQPATHRLRGVLAALNESDNNDRTLAQLLNTLAFDPSVNVRLTALEALYAHVDRAPVRSGVMSALSREPSPLVQVAMIDFVVASRDAEASPTLTRLTRDPSVDAVVRQAAQRGLAQL